jgi:hypothetical protein
LVRMKCTLAVEFLNYVAFTMHEILHIQGQISCLPCGIHPLSTLGLHCEGHCLSFPSHS